MIKSRMKLLGYIYVLLSVFFFSAMVILTKKLNAISSVSAAEITFFRFLLGFLVIASFKIITGKKIRTNNLRFLIDRSVFNCIAVYFLFLAIALTTATKANLYNMTYPIFVALIAHFTLGEKLTPLSISSIIIGFAGVIFVINPTNITNVSWGDAAGILSGITAGYSVVSLKKVTGTDTPFTILYYHMGIGTALSLVLSLFNFTLPPMHILYLLLVIGVLGLLGQYFFTVAYAYVTSVEGAVISTSRILVVALLGIVFLGDQITPLLITGSLLIMSGIIILALKPHTSWD